MQVKSIFCRIVQMKILSLTSLLFCLVSLCYGQTDFRKGYVITHAHILFFDCVDIRDDIQRLRLRERNLTDLVETYNKCRNQPGITFKAVKPWLNVAVMMGGGMDASSSNFVSHDLTIRGS